MDDLDVIATADEGEHMKLIARLAIPLSLLAVGIAPATVAHASAHSAPAGTRLWVQAYTGGPPGRSGVGTGLAVSPDRAVVYVTGVTTKQSGRRPDYDDATLAYDSATGAVLWETRYQGVNHPLGTPSIVVSPDGHMIFVAAAVRVRLGQESYLIEAYNARNGALLWTAQPSGILPSIPAQDPIAVSPDSGTVFITGFTYIRHHKSYTTVAFYAKTGVQDWDTTTPYSGPFGTTAIAVSPDGSAVFVTGGSGTLAYDANSGATLWQYRHTQGPVGLTVSPDSSTLYVTAADGRKKDYWLTTAYSTASGAPIWVARFVRPGGQAGAPAAVLVSPDGSQVIVGGNALSGNGESDFQLFSYDAATGARLWAATYSASPSRGTSATAMAITPNGAEVVLTGDVGSYPHSVYVTAGFNASTGSRLWAARLTGLASGETVPAAVGTSSDSARVFVTGGSFNFTADAREYLTAAYHT
ncbi:MAG TPA: PQQ-binding-like beta-propeller repeat protein [Streptosporangiaceae bacterium]